MPNPTFTGLLGEWAKGCSAETARHLAGTDLSIVSVFEVYDYLQARRAKMDHPGLARDVKRLRTIILRRLDGAPSPLPMVLHCPDCGKQHIDAPEPETGWTNPPHKSHTCHGCGTVWRPADVETVGVAAIETRGSRDTWNGKANAATRLDGAERVRKLLQGRSSVSRHEVEQALNG